MANITIIPAISESDCPTKKKKLRVAAYARVSTDSEEQLNSYTNQCSYYKELITNNPDYIYVDLYTDEGVSGTSTKNRDGFNRMVKDALDGKIDLILIKSISRLGRNTVDNLNALRELKAKGVDVYFETLNFHTKDASSEVLFTIFSSLAQEESHNISENVGWAIKKKFSRGEFSLPYKCFLGYERGPDGKPQIVEEEAKIVREIYKLFMDGYTPANIATHLTEKGVKTPSGKSAKWQTTSVLSILQNEKYSGCALLQKCYVPDFLDHKAVVNQGQLKQYFVENSHPAIIKREVWELVQGEFEKRKGRTRAVRNNVLSNRVFCQDCGGIYGAKVWHSTSKYRRVIYQCNNKFKQEKHCSTANVTEEQIKSLFIKAVNDLIDNDEYNEVKQVILDNFAESPELADELLTYQAQGKNLAMQMESLISQLAKNGNATLFQRQYDLLENDLKKAQDKIEEIKNIILERRLKYVAASEYFETLESIKAPLEKFDDMTFVNLIDTVWVGKDEIKFIFKDGFESIIKIK